jgi:ketosteroid isomerase-like protein
MRSKLLLAALVWGGAAAAMGAGPGADAIEARDRELNAAIVRHDVGVASTIYEDDFVLTTSSGRSKSRDDLLAEIARPGLAFEVNEMTDAVVRVHGDTAVLTGILHQRGSIDGKPFDVRLRVTDTWVRQRGTWRILAGHASVVPAN